MFYISKFYQLKIKYSAIKTFFKWIGVVELLDI